MKIAILGDLHEHFPYINDGVDMVIFCGDFCSTPSSDKIWIDREKILWNTFFTTYLKEIRSRKIYTVGCPGNHDFYPQSSKTAFQQVQSYFDVFTTRGYRQILGFDFYFFCYNKLEGYAYYKKEFDTRKMLGSFATRPIDFVVTHTPSYDILSMVPNWGSMPIRQFIERIEPKVHVFGHCHSDFGHRLIDNTLRINASYCMANNHPRYLYMVYDTDTTKLELVQTSHCMSLGNLELRKR